MGQPRAERIVVVSMDDAMDDAPAHADGDGEEGEYLSMSLPDGTRNSR